MAAEPPLHDLRVLELAGLAPGPFCGLLLSTYGASVLRIDRPHPDAHSPPSSPKPPPTSDLLTSYKSSVALDLKCLPSRAVFLSLISTADVLIDPFRPGVLEKLGLDPHTVLLKLNPRLIVARLTGFRRDGKYKDMAGHDINYLAVSGVLSLLGGSKLGNEAGKPPPIPPFPPANILADFAGGGMVAFLGILLALIHRSLSSSAGKGQVVEANMVDGPGFLATFPRLAMKTPTWDSERGTNLLDGGSPFYTCYECRDPGRYLAVGALEPQFFAALLRGLDLCQADVLPPPPPPSPRSDGSPSSPRAPTPPWDRSNKLTWPHMRSVFAQCFRTKTRREWEATFDGTDACVTPVLTMQELEQNHYEQRPMVALSTSAGKSVDRPWNGRGLRPGEGGEEVLAQWLGWRRGKDFDVHEERGALVVRGNGKGNGEERHRGKGGKSRL